MGLRLKIEVEKDDKEYIGRVLYYDESGWVSTGDEIEANTPEAAFNDCLNYIRESLF